MQKDDKRLWYLVSYAFVLGRFLKKFGRIPVIEGAPTVEWKARIALPVYRINCLVSPFNVPCFGTKIIQEHSQFSLNRHLYDMDTPVKQTPRVGPCPSLLPLFYFL